MEISKVVVDADLFMEPVARSRFREPGDRLYKILESGFFEANIIPMGFAKISDFLNKQLPNTEAVRMINRIKEITKICPEDIISRLLPSLDLSNIKDLESALEDALAGHLKCRAIVTENFDNFDQCHTKLWSVDDFEKEKKEQIKLRIKKWEQIVSTEEFPPQSNNPTRLSEWFNGDFPECWQDDIVISVRDLVPVNCIKRAKQINMGMQREVQGLRLVITLVPHHNNSMKVVIRVALYPSSGQPCIPPNLKLFLLDQVGSALKEVQSGNQDDLIRLNMFTCSRGQKFSIKIVLDNVTVVEEFVV